MKPKFTKLYALFLTLLILLSGCGNAIFIKNTSNPSEPSAPSVQSGKYNPDMWTVTSPNGGGKLYLFGSIHVADESVYPLPAYVTEAYDECSYVAVECDIVAFEQLSPEKIAEYYYPLIYIDGTTIKDHIDSEVYEACKQILTEHGFYSPYLDLYHPSMWMSYLSNAALSHTDFQIDNGIDRHFISNAKQDGKGILEIENIADQLVLELQFSDEMLTYLLSDYAEENVFEDYSRQLSELFSAWKTGTLEEYLLDDSDSEEMTEQEKLYEETYEKVTLTDRNIGMAAAATEYITSGKDVFYIVGAAHMYGENGVIALLEKEGFTVTPVN